MQQPSLIPGSSDCPWHLRGGARHRFPEAQQKDGGTLSVLAEGCRDKVSQNYNLLCLLEEYFGPSSGCPPAHRSVLGRSKQ